MERCVVQAVRPSFTQLEEEEEEEEKEHKLHHVLHPTCVCCLAQRARAHHHYCKVSEYRRIRLSFFFSFILVDTSKCPLPLLLLCIFLNMSLLAFPGTF